MGSIDTELKKQIEGLEKAWIQKLRVVREFHFPAKYFHETPIPLQEGETPPPHNSSSITLNENILTKLKSLFPDIPVEESILCMIIFMLTKLGNNSIGDIWLQIFDKNLESKLTKAGLVKTFSSYVLFSFPTIKASSETQRVSTLVDMTRLKFRNQQQENLTYAKDIFDRNAIRACANYKNNSIEGSPNYAILFPKGDKISIQLNQGSNSGAEITFTRPGLQNTSNFLTDLLALITEIKSPTPLQDVQTVSSYDMQKVDTILRGHKPIKNSLFVNDGGIIGVNVELELPSAEVIEKSYVKQWEFTFDYEYTKVDDNPFTGWNSSYTDKPIPVSEMQVWRTNTIDAIIKNCNLTDVMEIGCGNGLLLLPIAPKCTTCVGSDFSLNSVNHLNDVLKAKGISNVTLKHREAKVFDGEKPSTFDTIISNSVLQYFTNAEYLLEVIEGAIPLCKPGGKIFLGDLLNLAHLEQLKVAILLHKLHANASRTEFLNRFRDSLFFENELIIHPNFFKLLALKHKDTISGFDFLYHRGGFHNEVIDFRFNAILYINDGNSDKPSPPCPKLIQWQAGQTAEDLKLVLMQNASTIALVITNIPNARTYHYSRARNFVQTQDEKSYLDSLKEFLNKIKGEGIHPEELAQIGEDLGYTDVKIMPSDKDPTNLFHILFNKDSSTEYIYSNYMPSLDIDFADKKYTDFVTNPVTTKGRRTAEKALKQFLLTNKSKYDISQFHLYDDSKSFKYSVYN